MRSPGNASSKMVNPAFTSRARGGVPILDSEGKIPASYFPAGSEIDGATLFTITSAQDAQGLVDGSPVLTVDGATGLPSFSEVGTYGIATSGGSPDNTAFSFHDARGQIGYYGTDQNVLIQGGAGKGVQIRSNGSGTFGTGNIAIDVSSVGREVGIGREAVVGNALTVNTTVYANTFEVNDAGFCKFSYENTNAVRWGPANEFRIGTNASSALLLGYGRDVVIGTATADPVYFRTDGTNRAYFDTNGALRLNSDTAGALRIGAGDDLWLWHDGTNSWIQNYTGILALATAASTDMQFRIGAALVGKWDDANGALIVGGAAAQSGAKLDIQTTGQAHAVFVADVDGTMHFPWDATLASPNIAFGAGSEASLYHDGIRTILHATAGAVRLQSAASAVQFYANDALVLSATTRGTAQITPLASDPGTPSDGDIWVTTAGDLKFRANGTTYTVTAT